MYLSTYLILSLLSGVFHWWNFPLGSSSFWNPKLDKIVLVTQEFEETSSFSTFLIQTESLVNLLVFYIVSSKLFITNKQIFICCNKMMYHTQNFDVPKYYMCLYLILLPINQIIFLQSNSILSNTFDVLLLSNAYRKYHIVSTIKHIMLFYKICLDVLKEQ